MRHSLLGSGLFALALLASFAFAQTPATATTIYSFAKSTGWNLDSTLLNDGAGGFYGVTLSGGFYGQGIAYHLTLNGDGTWSESTMHEFGAAGDGFEPNSDLVPDGSGNLYGVALQGGTTGNGTVYRLSPNLDGTWTETILYNFQGIPSDGSWPDFGLIFDVQGNLWGTTLKGGKYDGGTLFELTPVGDTWVQTFLYHFPKTGPGGWSPRGKLAVDAQGNMYAITENGGKFNHGTAWKFTISNEGGGMFTPIHQFGSGTDGADPLSGVVIDAQGNLYGTTADGGSNGSGTTFELSPTKSGGWTYKVLTNFTQGEHPVSGLLSDGAGGFYGTAPRWRQNGGGNPYVFHLTQTNNVWSLTKISNTGGGFLPDSGVIWGTDGKLYGTNAEGGTKFAGTVFQVSLN